MGDIRMKAGVALALPGGTGWGRSAQEGGPGAHPSPSHLGDVSPSLVVEYNH